jgi:LacI family purine nucleotide synthesis repressor
MKELAAYTGLSVSTVSLVLRGEAKKRSISQATQEKIWRAVKEHNYQPNMSAR